MPEPKTSNPPLWFRIVVDIPAFIARVCGAFLAMSFMVPDEVVSHLSWLRRLDIYISEWFLFEFVVRTLFTKPWKSYVLSVKGVLNFLAALHPTGFVPLEALRHAARFLMMFSATPFRNAIQEVITAVRKVVSKNKQSLINMVILIMACTFVGAIIISVLEQDITRPMSWIIITIFPFLELPVDFSPVTASGRILESLLNLFRYALLAWLGVLALKTWRLAVGDTSSDSEKNS